ncbi:ubiquitin specific peptidase 22 [Homo sapiens]|uniref:Ubiquitin specific peptidase 22 n=1 Tax=Homo sapiens TaxID=9606 RepID=J3QRV6_HUMAN|nr:ubiquitin specific peptidase 22 [Homo sapiens]KAI4048412.1 ubiquitin specific peptidase 22 [Homo sapiens]
MAPGWPSLSAGSRQEAPQLAAGGSAYQAVGRQFQPRATALQGPSQVTATGGPANSSRLGGAFGWESAGPGWRPDLRRSSSSPRLFAAELRPAQTGSVLGLTSRAAQPQHAPASPVLWKRQGTSSRQGPGRRLCTRRTILRAYDNSRRPSPVSAMSVASTSTGCIPASTVSSSAVSQRSIFTSMRRRSGTTWPLI